MNLKEIKEIINLMNENDLSEIEVEREGGKVKIKKAFGEAPEIVHRRPIEYRVETQPSAAAPAANGNSAPPAGNRKEIKSPMVGTFYRSSSPEAAAFVEVGQMVEIGQVVCIVEAMKLMNEIKSEVKGKIAEIHGDNGQPVEFGQILFTLEPVSN